MPFEDRVNYMEQGTGQVFYLWQGEDENDWVVGMFDGAQGGVEDHPRIRLQVQRRGVPRRTAMQARRSHWLTTDISRSSHGRCHRISFDRKRSPAISTVHSVPHPFSTMTMGLRTLYVGT